MRKPILLSCWAAAALLAGCGTLDVPFTRSNSAALEDPQAPPPQPAPAPAPSPPSPNPGGGGGCYVHTDVVDVTTEGDVVTGTVRIALRNSRIVAIPAPFALTLSNAAYTEALTPSGWRVTDFNGGNITGVVEDAGLEPGVSRQFSLQVHGRSDALTPDYVAIDSNKCLTE